MTDKQVLAVDSMAPNSEAVKAENGFKTLNGYGKFISGLGWGIVAVGIILVFVGFNSFRNFGIAGIIGGISGIVAGILMVANGQLITCFVAIERNTNQTKRLLEPSETLRQHS